MTDTRARQARETRGFRFTVWQGLSVVLWEFVLILTVSVQALPMWYVASVGFIAGVCVSGVVWQAYDD